ncbi:hypothetical protein KGP36_06895 [Patescibacteria group bacterium]|nr:hypothetical protein [Patescibacteria group bacterium]
MKPINIDEMNAANEEEIRSMIDHLIDRCCGYGMQKETATYVIAFILNQINDLGYAIITPSSVKLIGEIREMVAVLKAQQKKAKHNMPGLC